MAEYTTGRATPIKNRNFLSPVGFKFTLDRAKSVSFFSNQANIPDITLGVAEQPTWLKDIPVPAHKKQEDKPSYQSKKRHENATMQCLCPLCHYAHYHYQRRNVPMESKPRHLIHRGS